MTTYGPITIDGLTFTAEVRPVLHRAETRDIVISEIVTVTATDAEGRVVKVDRQAWWRDWETGRLVVIKDAPPE